MSPSLIRIRQTACKRLLPGSLIVHSCHTTPLVLTRERNDQKQRLAVSIGGGTVRWLDKDEKVIPVPRAMREIVLGAGISITATLISAAINQAATRERRTPAQKRAFGRIAGAKRK